jgi:membrane AbrB-like protein
MRVPLWLARVCFVLIGMLLGAVVTPETLAGITTWPASVALLTVSTLCMMVATTCYLRFAHGWDPLSALLGASPGAMAQVVALAAEFDADMRGVAIVQTMRVLMVTIGVPGGLALFGFAAGGVIVVPGPASGSSLVELAMIAILSSLMAYAMGVRRGKAALSSGCKTHPATAPAGSNRSSHGGNEVAEAFG